MSTLKRKAAAQNGTDAKKPKQQNASITSFFGAPKAGPSANKSTSTAPGSSAALPSDAPGPKFDKAKWVASLTSEQQYLLKLEIETLHESWLAHLKDEITTKEFLDLKLFLDRETSQGKKVFPPMEDVYSWSRHTPFNTVKVVILGQDPYHNVNQAHGLAFSVRPPTPAPPSLRNMYTCLKTDYPSFAPPPNKGGLLTPWADRGVLMLNTCLTVRAHEANSHSNRGWERFTQKVIDLVAAKRTRGVVFMAWGTPAGKRVLKVDQKRHLVLKSVHPSPLSAARGFFTCGHFRKANEWLSERYGEDGMVDWALVPGTSVFKKVVPVLGGGGEENKKMTTMEKSKSALPFPLSIKPKNNLGLTEEEEEAFALAMEQAEAEAHAEYLAKEEREARAAERKKRVAAAMAGPPGRENEMGPSASNLPARGRGRPPKVVAKEVGGDENAAPGEEGEEEDVEA